jgi:3-phenylpropionate/trans-cinnamate dioxygenase ferredoxin subunit
MNYEFAARTSSLATETMKSVEVGGHQLLLANLDGRFYAVARKCTHFGGNLCNGKLVDGIVTCHKHGARFDLRTGRAVGQATMLIFHKLPKDLRSYPVKIEGDQVLIGI